MGGGGRKMQGKVVWPGYTEIEPRRVAKVGRNDPCPCNSGKKYKDCHEKDGSAYLERLARADDRERLKELRRQMKKQGIPWYRRIFFRQ